MNLLAPEETGDDVEDEGEEHREEEHRRDRNVDAGVFGLDADVTGEVPEPREQSRRGEPHHESDHDQDQAENDEDVAGAHGSGVGVGRGLGVRDPFQFLPQLLEGGADGGDESGGCLFQAPADHGITEGGPDRGEEGFGGRSQGAEGVFDLGFAGSSIVGHLPVLLAEGIAQFGEADRQVGPSVGSVHLRMISRMRLHLLDGTYELFRAHFGRPPRTSPDGREVSATLGVIETTLSLLRQPGVTHLAVATDHVIESFRNELFSGYKSSEGVPPELLSQFDLVEDALRALGVVVWPMVEFEADDAIATAAARWRHEVDQVVIETPDKDLAQCVVEDKVVTHDRRKDVTYDEGAVRRKFGVGPASIPDFLALVGDKADGVPGLPGWGAKSTAAVLARYPHLEDIPEDPELWEVDVRNARTLAAVLMDRWDDALLYRTLTTLRTDVPLTEELADLQWRGVRRDEFLSLCDRLGFGAVRDRPHRWVD